LAVANNRLAILQGITKSEYLVLRFNSFSTVRCREAHRHMKLAASKGISHVDNIMGNLCSRGHGDTGESSCMKQLRWKYNVNVHVFPFTRYNFLINILHHCVASLLSHDILLFVNKQFNTAVTNPKSMPSPFSFLFLTQFTELGMILTIGTYT
jgi:hypothetical protein